MPGSRTWTDSDASRLKALREALGWDLAGLARRSALSVSQVRQLEEGGDGAFYSPEIKCAAGRRVLERLVAAGGQAATGDNAPEEA
jgi:transcriptional regulator with XRE-family HTH domain